MWDSKAMEAAVCFLVESSNATDPFLRAIRDNIIAFLQSKVGKGGYFRFNLAHFSRDHVFWDDEVGIIREVLSIKYRQVAGKLGEKQDKVV